MWTSSHTNVFKGMKKEDLWERWADVNHWHEWVPNIEFCHLDKPFRTGSDFTLKPKGAPAVKVELIEVEKEKKFTGCTRFFGATLYDTYEIQNEPQGTRLTVTLKLTGPLGFVWRKLVAEKIDANLPKLMRNLASLSNLSSVSSFSEFQSGIGGTILQNVKSTASSAKPKRATSTKAKSASSKPKARKTTVKKKVTVKKKTTAKKTTAKKTTVKKKAPAKKIAAKKIAVKKKTSTVKKAKPKAKTAKKK